MQKITKELICDLCGAGGARRWRIQNDETGGKRSPDLCPEHSKVLDLVFEKLPAGSGRRSRPREVLTEAQIRAQRRKS